VGITHDEGTDLADRARQNGAETVVSKTVSVDRLLALVRGES
jgi:hypothetical protein